MPRTATLTESGNKNTVWTNRTVNVENSHAVNGTATQQQDLNTVKVGVVFRVRDSTNWKGTGYSFGTSQLIIGGTTYTIAEYACTTSYVTKTMDSGNFKTTKRFTQSDVDAMYYQEIGRETYQFGTRTIYTASRVHKIEYCYEHKIGGLAAMKIGKIGGLDIGKVWKVGGRSQISGNADIAET